MYYSLDVVDLSVLVLASLARIFGKLTSNLLTLIHLTHTTLLAQYIKQDFILLVGHNSTQLEHNLTLL